MAKATKKEKKEIRKEDVIRKLDGQKSFAQLLEEIIEKLVELNNRLLTLETLVHGIGSSRGEDSDNPYPYTWEVPQNTWEVPQRWVTITDGTSTGGYIYGTNNASFDTTAVKLNGDTLSDTVTAGLNKDTVDTYREVLTDAWEKSKKKAKENLS